MDNLQKAIASTHKKDAVGFKESLASELASRLHAAIMARKDTIAKGLNQVEQTETDNPVVEANVIAPSAPVMGGIVGIPGSERSNSGAGEIPDPLEDELRNELESAFGLKEAEAPAAAAEAEDTSLDPNFEKEYYMKETNYRGHKVVLKQVGLGLSKPIRVYVDEKRWEFFPGPEIALKACKNYIDEMIKKSGSDVDAVDTNTDDADSKKEESFDMSDDTLSEKVSLDGRTKLYRETRMRIEQGKKSGKTNSKETITAAPTTNNKPLTTEEMVDSIRVDWNGAYSVEEAKLSPKQKEYRKFFKGALDKHGAKSPDELSVDKKKKLFNYVKANWKG